MSESAKDYFIWSVEHDGWWKPNKAGYCASWSSAGRYSKEEAYQISARANWCSLNEVPIPVSFFEFQCKMHKAMESMKP